MRRICGIGYWRQRSGFGEVAERFGVSQAYVSRVRSRHGRLGQASAGAQHNHVPLRLGGLKEPLLAQVALAPEQTLAQLCQWVKAEHGIAVGPANHGLGAGPAGADAKKKTVHASEQKRSDVAQARTAWAAEQRGHRHGRLIFLD
jgi:hypothetical protein